MLVLSRKTDQSIHIGDSIVITVLRVEGNKVRLGIRAPADVPILREELEPRRGEEHAEPAQPLAR